MDGEPHEQEARWLRDLIEATGLRSSDFARGAGLTGQQISNWTHGRFRIGLKAALRLRETYGVTLDYLYTGSLEALPEDLRRKIIQIRGRRQR